MKKLFYLIIAASIITGCGEKEQEKQTVKVDLDSARHNIIVAINNFNIAYVKKDLEGMKKLLSGTVHMFGTDSSSIINSSADFEKELNRQWDKYGQVKIGAPNYLYIEVDKDAELANAIYQVLLVWIDKGTSYQKALRFSNTYKKENGEWKLVHMIMQEPLNQSNGIQIRK